MGRVELRGVKSQEMFVKKVKEAVQGKLHGEWLLGGGWNNDMWGGDLPVASWIDDITCNNPVWLSRMDGHMGLANSVALKIAGITDVTNDPVGGTIVKTADGEPTGLLVDSAMKLVLDVIPEVSSRERRDALARASKYALMKGVTTVVDFGRYFPGAPAEHAWQDFSDVYKWADSAGKMLIRACLFFPMQTWSHLVDLFQESGRVISPWIYLGGTKAFADGSLGSNSALFYEPDHLLDDAVSAEKKIGGRAKKGSYLFQSLLASGAHVAFGSDWPVADINPLGGIRTALSRLPPGSETPWIPSERVGLNDALNAYTISAAFACFLDHELGSLSPGKYADFVVLPASSWDELAEEVPTIVSATYVNGKQVYP